MFTHFTRRVLTTTTSFRSTFTPTSIFTNNVSTTMPRPRFPPLKPLIILTGSTGTGKSSLAISICQILSRQYITSSSAFEIINADAMQLYLGLPVITNKITAEEQQDVPHHLLGTIGLEEETWTVKRFVGECDRVIEEVRARGNVPILVGGTGYYVHGVVLGEGVGSLDGEDVDNGANVKERDIRKEGGEEWKILDGSTEDIYRKLEEVDPVMASRWHPSDRRKIQRSLEIYLKTGRRASDIYEEQKRRGRVGTNETEDTEGIGSNSHCGLRYDSLVLWLDAEDATLKDRLNKRVDTMVQNGLLEEAKEMAAFEQELKQKNTMLDKTKGIWVSIGYKELEPWLDHVKDQSEEAKSAVILQQSCIEAVKASTRRYAKRQNRYLRIRLAQALATADAAERLFLLDCTDLEGWQRKVVEPACDIVNTFLKGGELPRPADLSNLARKTFDGMADGADASTDRVARRCESCDKVLMTEKEWLNHLRSRSHKKVLEGIRKRSLYEERCIVAAKVKDSKDPQNGVQTSDLDPT